jgi:predicted RNA-binding Zn-ribbon protein involved in translation (DUF1610 family)
VLATLHRDSAVVWQTALKEVMIDGHHYGVIPGTDGKKSLLKPGAEKICSLFMLAPSFSVQVRELANDHREYQVLCTLTHTVTGVMVAQADGSCSTRESKYRWRIASRKCPNCGEAAIRKGKEEYGGGFYCADRFGGCGAKFKAGDKQIIDHSSADAITITSTPQKTKGIANRLLPRDTQIRIEYKQNWNVTVLSFGSPTDGLTKHPYWDDTAKRTVLFAGPPGSYLVLAYDRTTGDSTQELVTISGKNDPDPPGPNPPVPPKPDDTIPSDLHNTYGLGRVAYLYARRVNNPSEALKLAEAYSSALIKLNQLATTVPLAEESVRKVRETLPAWADLDEQLEPALTKAIEQYGSSPNIYTRYFYEISEALSRSTK